MGNKQKLVMLSNIKITIDDDTLSWLLFSFFNSAKAFKAIGVAAIPSPNKLATKLAQIYSFAILFGESLGNNFLINGLNNLVVALIRPLSIAIWNNPL